LPDVVPASRRGHFGSMGSLSDSDRQHPIRLMTAEDRVRLQLHTTSPDHHRLSARLVVTVSEFPSSSVWIRCTGGSSLRQARLTAAPPRPSTFDSVPCSAAARIALVSILNTPYCIIQL
jgi:hypothetical protein